MRIRRIQRELARRQTMKEIPQGDCGHCESHALSCGNSLLDRDTWSARVVAKGKNYLAGRIRPRAIEHQVRIVENPPLPRARYTSVEVGQEIPLPRVAEILAYIYKLMNERLPT